MESGVEISTTVWTKNDSFRLLVKILNSLSDYWTWEIKLYFLDMSEEL